MDRILVINSDPNFSSFLESVLANDGYHVETASSLAAAAQLARNSAFHLLLTASELSDADALTVIRWAEQQQRGVPVVIVVPIESVERARAALAAADGVLFRSASNADDPRKVVARALERRHRMLEYESLCRAAELDAFDIAVIAADPLGHSAIRAFAAQFASPAPIFLAGERGVLFEVLARFIHRRSPRAGHALQTYHFVPGSATAADDLLGVDTPSPRPGLLEAAHLGTLFLSDIAHCPLPLQSSLLEFLDSGSFAAGEGGRRIHSGARLVLASVEDLAAAAASGQFLPALHQRLMSLCIEVPPLRLRPLDVLPLATRFLEQKAVRLGKPAPRISGDAAQALVEYHWPGNSWELRALMERAALLCSDSVLPGDLAFAAAPPGSQVRWRDIERRAIEEALRANNGNRTRAARQLGISLRKLQYRIKQFGMGRNQRPPALGAAG
jgi:DNA-binding NtrC family response regulator